MTPQTHLVPTSSPPRPDEVTNPGSTSSLVLVPPRRGRGRGGAVRRPPTQRSKTSSSRDEVKDDHERHHMTTTCGCGRPTADSSLCHGCTTHLEHDLADITALAEQLDIVIARQTAYGNQEVEKRPGASTPVPFEPAASDIRTALRAVLSSWVRLVAEERHVAAPTAHRQPIGRRSGYVGYPPTAPTPDRPVQRCEATDIPTNQCHHCTPRRAS